MEPNWIKPTRTCTDPEKKGILIDFDVEHEEENNVLMENKPYLKQCLGLHKAWLRNAWPSRRCPSRCCRSHPWERGCLWLLSTASLPMNTKTHKNSFYPDIPALNQLPCTFVFVSRSSKRDTAVIVLLTVKRVQHRDHWDIFLSLSPLLNKVSHVSVVLII